MSITYILYKITYLITINYIMKYIYIVWILIKIGSRSDIFTHKINKIENLLTNQIIIVFLKLKDT